MRKAVSIWAMLVVGIRVVHLSEISMDGDCYMVLRLGMAIL